jgi:hypothetical protein
MSGANKPLIGAVERLVLAAVRARNSDRRVACGAILFVAATVLAGCRLGQTTSPPAPPPPSSSMPAPTGTADQSCTDNPGQNGATPDFYRQQYADGLAKDLSQKLTNYDSAVGSGQPRQIGTAAGDLFSAIKLNDAKVKNPRVFGCYDPNVLMGLQTATDAFAATLDDMACAGASTCDKTPADIPDLAGQAKPQEQAFIDAMNAYAAQFGGQQIPQP